MSVINFMNHSLSTAAEGFTPSHAPLKNNKHLNILFSQLSRGKEKKKNHNNSEPQSLTPLFWVCAYGTKGGSLGPCLILSVMPNAAPDSNVKSHSLQLTQLRKGKNKSESQSLTPSFQVHAYRTKGGGLGPCLYFVSNA